MMKWLSLVVAVLVGVTWATWGQAAGRSFELIGEARIGVLDVAGTRRSPQNTTRRSRTDPLVRLKDASHITFDGIVFEMARAGVVEIEGGSWAPDLGHQRVARGDLRLRGHGVGGDPFADSALERRRLGGQQVEHPLQPRHVLVGDRLARVERPPDRHVEAADGHVQSAQVVRRAAAARDLRQQRAGLPARLAQLGKSLGDLGCQVDLQVGLLEVEIWARQR